ncbi:hypothetical protein NLG97_g8504 [Lecanicillium saksenae]|uniref:Uncharacterized protein n=1 Tax=Lecanicillium saksenae TaxID=468837 RepID=A0ACC1QLQ8_9HYPO|nr:hypothetical protein NLG97_g8504 [Lecanicillium saksenae]
MAMEYEPVPKRRRTASPPLPQDLDSNIQPQIPPQTSKPPTGEDDGAYQQYLERAFADPRFRSTLAQIFDKYDRKSAQPDGAIDPVLCGIPAGGSRFAGPAIDTQLDSMVHVGNVPYHLNTVQGGPKDDHGQTLDYQVDRSSLTPGPYGPEAATSGYVPDFPGGAHPGLMQSWYTNPFHGPGPYAPPWDSFSGQFPTPNDPHMATNPWMAPDNVAYNSTTWPPQANPSTQDAAAMSHENPVLDPLLLAQSNASEVFKPEERRLRLVQEDESTDNCQPEFEISRDSLGRKRRRRVMQPRFSKNGKRLGRPPKGQEAPVPQGDAVASDAEGEDNDGLADLKNPAGDFGAEDDDTLWGELAEALQLASKATSKKRSKDSTKPAQKGENSATESDGAAEAEKDAGQAETMLRKIQQELIDRAVRRSTLVEEQADDADAGAEGRRRSGRERKATNFGEQVSWDKVSAERKAGYKIKMHLRALSVQARRERKNQEKEEAERAAKEKEEADKKKQEEKLAAAAAAAEKGTNEGYTEPMPSTIPDSQDTVTSLPIRTTPKKPQSKNIMRQTSKNHVNSVVHFEEDDEGPSDDDAPAPFPVKTPVFAYKKAEPPVNSFLGENYIDTVYALSDDEAPTLLDSLQRVSIGSRKQPSLVPVAVAQPRQKTAVPKQNSAKDVGRVNDTGAMKPSASKEPTSASQSDSEAVPHSVMDTDDAIQPCAANASEQNGTARPAGGGDGDDSGIDIPSEQASSEQAERRPATKSSVPVEPLFQDPDLLGAADLLDSLDVMSETEDVPSSPVVGYDLEKENLGRRYLPVTSSKITQPPIFADEEQMEDSMGDFADVTADMPLVNEKPESEYERAAEPLTIPKRNTAKHQPVSQERAIIRPSTENQYTNISFAVGEKHEEIVTKQIQATRTTKLCLYFWLESVYTKGYIKGTLADQFRGEIEITIIQCITYSCPSFEIRQRQEEFFILFASEIEAIVLTFLNTLEPGLVVVTFAKV